MGSPYLMGYTTLRESHTSTPTASSYLETQKKEKVAPSSSGPITRTHTHTHTRAHTHTHTCNGNYTRYSVRFCCTTIVHLSGSLLSGHTRTSKSSFSSRGNLEQRLNNLSWNRQISDKLLLLVDTTVSGIIDMTAQQRWQLNRELAPPTVTVGGASSPFRFATLI